LCRAICWRAARASGLTIAAHRGCVDDESALILQRQLASSIDAYLDGRPAVLPKGRRFAAWLAAHRNDVVPVEPDASRGRAYALRGIVHGHVDLAPGSTPERASDVSEELALAALARAQDEDVRQLRVTLTTNARPSSELREAVGCYAHDVELVLSGRPVRARLARADERPDASGIGIVVSTRATTERAADAEPGSIGVGGAARTTWSARPLEIENTVTARQWHTRWRFDEAVHARAAVEERCQRFVAAIARLTSDRSDATMAGAFEEADLSGDELAALLG
jgi:hypothetical protein